MTILLVFMIHQVNGYKNHRPPKGRAVVSTGKPFLLVGLHELFHFMLNLGIPPQGKCSECIPIQLLLHTYSIYIMHCI